ncbi:MAG: AAA family ATPase [Sandaracinaceae bacterium]|nr:AAA family ATPase [Sandaracinaceae bacterium]
MSAELESEHSIERAYIGALMVSASLQNIAALSESMAVADDFGTQEYASIATAASELLDRRTPPDFCALYSHLCASGKRDIATTLTTLVDAGSNTILPSAYLAVKDAAAGRARRTALKQAMSVADSGADVDVDALSATLRDVGSASTVDAYTQRDLLRLAVTRYMHIAAADGSHRLRLNVGDLDHTLGGLDRGCLTVIGARPSVGKSSIAMFFAERAALNGARTSIVSLEDSPEGWATRLLAMKTRLNASALRAGGQIGEGFKRLDASVDSASDTWQLVDVRGRKLAEVSKAIETKCRAHSSDIVIVDYAQKIRGTDAQDRRNEMDSVIDAVKASAVRIDAHVILLSQLSRAGKENQEVEPGLDRLKESGGFEEQAENVLLMWREYDKREKKEMRFARLAKNKSGPVGAKYLIDWHKESACVVDVREDLHEFGQ